MKSLSVLILSLCSITSAWPVAVPPVAHDGPTKGTEIEYNNLTLYVTGKKTDTAVLYLSDIYGIQLAQNKLLADSFGRAGYLTVAPDLFDGEPAPVDPASNPKFNMTQFIIDHRPEITDPLVSTTIEYIQSKLGIEKIAVAGYCFGGRYTFRFLAPGKGPTVGFAAHPSRYEDGEILGIAGPVTIAAAESDSSMSPARRLEVTSLLESTDQIYSMAVYSGTTHGFAVRGNVSIPEVKYAKEEAFFQAVRFFDTWLK